ncbi:MAG: nitrate reductase molybdenum cofactor assembly chaperone [Burkholderiales bacterium]
MNTLSRQLRALALLLDYPRDDLYAHLADIDELLAPLDMATDARNHESLHTLIADMIATDPMDLQAQFIETFDRGRSTSLNLFEHVHGDSKDRGQAMVDLLAQYEEIGLRLQVKELPDYLPIYLEYVSVLDSAAAIDALQEIAPLLANLAVSLSRRKSPWLAVLAALCRLAEVADWQALIAQETSSSESLASPDPRDALRASAPPDWTAEGLDAAWAEEPVSFLGACDPQPAHPAAQTMRFVPNTSASSRRS